MRKPGPVPRPLAAFTLVEVMMAATILTIGFLGLLQVLAMSSGLMDQARRQTLATEILSGEIEQLRLNNWAQIQSQTDTAKIQINSANYPNSPFLTSIQSSGAVFFLQRSISYIDPLTNLATPIDTGLKEITFTLTWEVTTNRLDGAGNPSKLTYVRVNSAYFGKNGLNLAFQRS